ncbi:MAG: 50S ribosomal protein L29 [archaeon]
MNKKLAELRKMTTHDRVRRMTELKNELAAEQAVKSTNTRPESPGKAKNLRKSIARILTLNTEDEIKKIRGVAN